MSSSFRATLIASATAALFIGPLMAPGVGAVWAQTNGHFNNAPGRPVWVVPSPPVLGGSFIAPAATYGAQLRVALAPASVYQEVGLSYNPALTTARELTQTLPDGSAQLVVRLSSATPGPVYALAQVATPTGQRFVQFQLTDNAPSTTVVAHGAATSSRNSDASDPTETANTPSARRAAARARAALNAANAADASTSDTSTTNPARTSASASPVADNSPALGSVAVRSGDTLNAISTALARPGKAAALSQALYARNLSAFNGSINALNANVTLQVPQRASALLSPEGLSAVKTGSLPLSGSSILPTSITKSAESTHGSTFDAPNLGSSTSAAAGVQLRNALQRGLSQGKADAVADASANVSSVSNIAPSAPLNLDAIPNTVGGSLRLRVLLAEKTAELAQVRSAQARMAQREHDLEQQISSIQGRLDSMSTLLDHDSAALARAQSMADRYGSAGRAKSSPTAASPRGMNPAPMPAMGASTPATPIDPRAINTLHGSSNASAVASTTPVMASGVASASSAATLSAMSPSGRPMRPLLFEAGTTQAASASQAASSAMAPHTSAAPNGLPVGASGTAASSATATSARPDSASAVSGMPVSASGVDPASGAAVPPEIQHLIDQTKLTSERARSAAPRPGLASAVRANTGTTVARSQGTQESTSISWGTVLGGSLLIVILGGIAIWQRRRRGPGK